jgi:hypothetical protein
VRGMTRATKEIALGLTFVAGYVFLVLHWLPVRQEYSLSSLCIKLLPPVMLNLAGWWRWVRVRHGQDTASWRKVVGLPGLVAVTLATIVPWIVFYYDFILVGFDMRRYPASRLPGWKVIDLYLTFRSCLLVSLVVMVLGFAAPRRIRLAVVLGGFATGWLIMSFPIVPIGR